MIKSDLNGKTVLILGYGLEGIAAEKELCRTVPMTTIGVTDRRVSPKYLDACTAYDCTIKTPGIPGHLVPTQYTTGAELFLQEFRDRAIGVTGTKGKSTTTSMLFHVLHKRIMSHGTLIWARNPQKKFSRVKIGGNIGVPLMSLFEDDTPDTLYVCELSSYMLADVTVSPFVSIVINLYPDHLDYHENLHQYYEAKRNIVRFSRKDDVFIYHGGFDTLVSWAQEENADAIGYGMQPAEPNTLLDSVPVYGKHNRDNIAAVTTAAREWGIDETYCYQALQDFAPLRHRLETLGTYRGVTFIDDAISTTPDSTIAGIEAVTEKQRIGAILLGGQNRGYRFRELGTIITQKQIPVIILFPDSGKEIKKELLLAGYSADALFETGSMEEAVDHVFRFCPRDTVCLLSTASPSYSLWKNFEEKGDIFRSCVEKAADQYDTKTNPHSDTETIQA